MNRASRPGPVSHGKAPWRARRQAITTIKIAGLIIALLGALALIYGGFTYVKDSHDADLGPIEFQVQEKERVNIPVWAGVAAVVAGGAMFLYPKRRSSP